MTALHALILGIVEGATEFLPVSSTGHLILAGKLLGIPDSSFLTTFEIAVQLGAILAVVVLYWRSFLNIGLLKKLVVSFVPTGIVGLALYPYIKSMLDDPYIVVVFLFFGGIALVAFEIFHRERPDGAATPEALTYRQALAIGVFQSLAVVPGVSRSAATIVGGLAIGVRRVAIVEFSFLLAVPTMAAATGLDLLKSYDTLNAADFEVLLLGGLAAFVVALFALRWLRAYVARYTFMPFGIYRIFVALLFFLLVLR